MDVWLNDSPESSLQIIDDQIKQRQAHANGMRRAIVEHRDKCDCANSFCDTFMFPDLQSNTEAHNNWWETLLESLIAKAEAEIEELEELKLQVEAWIAWQVDWKQVLSELRK